VATSTALDRRRRSAFIGGVIILASLR
jgi:hypothetical protein